MPHMTERGRGRIVNLNSGAATFPLDDDSDKKSSGVAARRPGLTLRPLNGSGSLERVVHRDGRRTRDTDRRSDPFDLRVPLEESLELLCGFPLIDHDELGGASDESVMKNSSALGVLSDLFEESGVGLQTLDGFGDVGNREVNDGCDTHG